MRLLYNNLSRVVTDLLTGCNTLRRHIYIMGLIDSPLCRRCGTDEENSSHVVCECEALVTLRHNYLGSLLDPEDVRNLSLGAIWNFNKGTGLLDCSLRGIKGLSKPHMPWDRKVSYLLSILLYSITACGLDPIIDKLQSLLDVYQFYPSLLS